MLSLNHLTLPLSCFSGEKAKENFYSLEHCLIMRKTEITRLIFGLRWVLHVLVFNTEQRAPGLLIIRPTAILSLHLPWVHISYRGTRRHLKKMLQNCFYIQLNGFSLHTRILNSNHPEMICCYLWPNEKDGVMNNFSACFVFYLKPILQYLPKYSNSL